MVDTTSIRDSGDSLLLKLTATVVGGSAMVDPAGGVELTKLARGTSRLATPKSSSAAPKMNDSTREIRRMMSLSEPTCYTQ